MMKASLVILTWNRRRSVETSLKANMRSAGYPIYEIIHCDNGSEPGFADWFKTEFDPSVQIRNAQNLGVAAGYNRGLAMATGSHVIITGCDRVMPHHWLKKFIEAFEKIPNTGVISCYTETEPHDSRIYTDVHGIRSIPEDINGVTIQRARPVEARMHSKEFLFKAGFFREDFGIYGYEDAEWSDRANTTAFSQGMLNYYLPDLGFAKHLPDDDFGRTIDGVEYHPYKRSVFADPRLRKLFAACWKEGSPYYNPYARIEPNRLEEFQV